MNQAAIELGNQLQQNSSELAQQLKNMTEQHNKQLLEQSKTVQSQLENVSSGMVSGLQDSMTKLPKEEQARQAIGSFVDAINAQLRAFEEATEREMNRELEDKSLISISKGLYKIISN